MLPETVMEDWQQRVVEERVILSDKISKLDCFRFSKAFEELPLAEKELLHNQRYYMSLYLAVLEERTRGFKENAA